MTNQTLRELDEWKATELERFDDFVESKSTHEDFFGIERMSCQICMKLCEGFTPATNFVNPRAGFPTFCEACSCPSFFHVVSPDQLTFPEDLVKSLYRHKLSNQDINFNALTVVFEVTNNQEFESN